jgi:hypothetical protein
MSAKSLKRSDRFLEFVLDTVGRLYLVSVGESEVEGNDQDARTATSES